VWTSQSNPPTLAICDISSRDTALVAALQGIFRADEIIVSEILVIEQYVHATES
jgi:hypothetical protein